MGQLEISAAYAEDARLDILLDEFIHVNLEKLNLPASVLEVLEKTKSRIEKSNSLALKGGVLAIAVSAIVGLVIAQKVDLEQIPGDNIVFPVAGMIAAGILTFVVRHFDRTQVIGPRLDGILKKNKISIEPNSAD